MLSIVLALASAAMYGLSDFLGGVFFRRTSVWAVAVVTQSTALLVIVDATPFAAGTFRGIDWAWAARAGVGTGIGTAFVYRGLAGGRMGVVAPLSAAGAALVPVR